MKGNRGRDWLFPVVLAAFGIGLALGAWAAGGESLALWRQRPLAIAAIAGGVLLAVFGLLGVRNLLRRPAALTKRLASEVHTIAAAHAGHRLDPDALPEGFDDLAVAINDLAARYERLLTTQSQAIAQARTRFDAEHARLLALIQNLAESVLVCNRSGEILLYNRSAQALLGEMVGLGRPVFGLLKGNPLEQTLAIWEKQTSPAPRTFVTRTIQGRFVRVRMSPIVEGGEWSGDENRLQGFVLALEDITQRMETASRRDQLIEELGRNMRRGLANIRAASETMIAFPDMDTRTREKLERVLTEEIAALSQRLEKILEDYAEVLRARWHLEEMPLRDFAALLVHALDAVPDALPADIDRFWVQIDSPALLNALEVVVKALPEPPRLSIRPQDEHIQVTLSWPEWVISADALRQRSRTGEAGGLSMETVVEHHGGEVWVQSHPNAHLVRLVFLLPTPTEVAALTPAPSAPTVAPRPEYYDFDLLFRRPAPAPSLEAAPLNLLHYTVFDTETTGLAPTEDEIISIGAVRIVNARLLEGEAFHRMIKPRRPVPLSATRIHGIRNEDLRHAPPIEEVLPAFHRYAGDSVLVAHNAAFDMRFLQEAEKRTGVRFQQPVLDTLLLSAIVHPEHKDHSLEAIAERLGVSVSDRHSALGDALATARIFLKLIPLLQVRGVVTLGQAIAASEKTYFARIRY